MPGNSVLILEPDVMERDLMIMALKRGGLTPEICWRPDDLPGMLIDDAPDVLVIDLHMPGRNGLNLFSDMKKAGLLKRTRTLAVSAMAFPEIVQRLREAGVNDFLVKPLDADLLVSRVKRLLAASANTGTLAGTQKEG